MIVVHGERIKCCWLLIEKVSACLKTWIMIPTGSTLQLSNILLFLLCQIKSSSFLIKDIYYMHFHRPLNEVTVNSSFEVICFRFVPWFLSFKICRGKKPGSFGTTTSISHPPNIWITEVMVGLSSGYCCTHKRLTWMHSSTSEITHESFMLESINCKAFFSFQSVHAWNIKEENNKVNHSCLNFAINK